MFNKMTVDGCERHGYCCSNLQQADFPDDFDFGDIIGEPFILQRGLVISLGAIDQSPIRDISQNFLMPHRFRKDTLVHQGNQTHVCFPLLQTAPSKSMLPRSLMRSVARRAVSSSWAWATISTLAALMPLSPASTDLRLVSC